MNYAEIKYNDIANGEGVRVSLFVSGCRHRCKNCFNEIAWDFKYGKEFTDDVADKIIKSCEPDYVAGISLLGGEPFEPENQKVLYPFDGVDTLKDNRNRETLRKLFCGGFFVFR